MAHILIIEDQPADRDLLVVLLGYHGHAVLEARDGAEGLALTFSERPDLVITDILMPRMDGYEFARRVRADPELAGTRIMFYSATYLAEEVRQLAAAIGISYMLTKPAEPEHILEVVRAALTADLPDALAVPAPSADLDRQYLRLLATTLHRKVEQLKAEGRAREQAEQALQESEQRFRSTFEQAAVGIAHVAPDGHWLRVNQRLCEIVGYTRAELIERTFHDITYPADIDADLAYIHQMLAGDIMTYSMEKRYIRKDGSLIWINLTVSLVRDISGAPKYFISVIEDITERNRAAAALRQSEERFAKAFRVSPVAMTITRVSDNCFSDANERFCHMLGYSREETIGRSSLDLNMLANPADRAERVRIMRERGSLRDFETIVRTKSGELCAVLFSVEAIELAGEQYYLTSLVNISDRKRAEQALERSADRLRHLREIDQSILAGRPLAAIAQAAVGHLWELLACTRVSVVLVDMAARTITLFATQVRGELRGQAGLQAPLEILGEALEPLMRDQIYQMPDLEDLPELPPALHAARVEHVRAYCYVPILVDAELIGLLGLGSDEPGLFSAEQLDIAREAADQLSIAMQQVRLQDQIQRHAAELEQRVVERTAELQAALAKTEALYTITRAAIASEHLIEALQQVADRIAAALPADRIALIVFEQAERRVTHLIRGGSGLEHIVSEISFDEIMEGLSGWAVREQQSVLSPKGAPDPRESQLVQDRRAATNCGAIAVVPLRYLDRILGTLTAINLPEQPDFSAADLELMEAIAGQAAIALVRAGLYENLQHAIQLLMDRGAQMTDLNEELTNANAGLQAEIAERARLEEEIRWSAARAQALAALSKAIAEAGLDHQVLFETITRRVSELVGDACVLTLISEDAQWLNPVAFYHPDPDCLAFLREILPTMPYGFDQSAPGRVARTGEPVLVPVMPTESYRAQIKPELRPFLDRFGIASMLIVPMRVRGRIVGTLGVTRDKPGHPYTADDQTFLQDLADRAGTAIENTRLFMEVQQAREAAVQADLAKTEFLSHMSHELRTPLNAIIGFTGTLLMRLPGPLTADQEKQLNTVQSSARHLLSLINDLLDLAKIQSGKIELHPEPVICQEVIGEVAANLRQLAEQKGLRFDLVVPAEPIVLQTDQRALSQIIINLANNAIKFTERGSVRVSLRRKTNDQGRNGVEETAAPLVVGLSSLVEFAVHDTGIGIRAQDQPGLFEAFTQARPADSLAREGTGLGLHLSQRLAELLGGSIEFTSEFGQGSLFTLLIPEH